MVCRLASQTLQEAEQVCGGASPIYGEDFVRTLRLLSPNCRYIHAQRQENGKIHTSCYERLTNVLPLLNRINPQRSRRWLNAQRRFEATHGAAERTAPHVVADTADGVEDTARSPNPPTQRRPIRPRPTPRRRVAG